MESLLTGMTTAVGLMGDVWTAIIGNPLLTVFAAASLLGVGISIFAAIKGVAR